MGASLYAGIQARQNEKNNAEMKADLDKAKTAQDAAIEKAIAEKEKVLRAQSEAAEKSIQAQADSVKAQAWLASVGPYITAVVVGAFVAMKGR